MIDQQATPCGCSGNHSAPEPTVVPCGCGQPVDVITPFLRMWDAWLRCGLAAAGSFTSCVSSPCGCGGGCGCDGGIVIQSQPGAPGNTGTPAPSGLATAAPRRVVQSQPFTVRLKIATERRLEFEQPLSNNYLLIPNDRVTIKPAAGRTGTQAPVGHLAANETSFTIEVDATGLPGSTYSGVVRAAPTNGAQAESVKVFVELW